jgi:hypothetical protein
MSYQVLPPLSDDDFASLKADIAARGVLIPVEYDRRLPRSLRGARAAAMNVPPIAAAEESVDPRLAFLARAAARFELVQCGEMSIDEAYGDLVLDLPCPCVRETVKRWERADRKKRR